MLRTMLCCILTLSFMLSAAPLWADEECGKLITERCESCHYKSRVCQKLGKHTKRRWKRSIKNMVRYGAKLSKKEEEKLIDCLSKAPPGADYVCKYDKKS